MEDSGRASRGGGGGGAGLRSPQVETWLSPPPSPMPNGITDWEIYCVAEKQYQLNLPSHIEKHSKVLVNDYKNTNIYEDGKVFIHKARCSSKVKDYNYLTVYEYDSI